MAYIQTKNFVYLKGPKGDKGDSGPQGPRGPKGDKGEQGLRGPAGPTTSPALIRTALSGSSPINYNEITGQISFNSAGFATEDYVNTAISNLVDGAPNLLNTLNEIAAAIGDNANFAATVLLKAGGTMTGPLLLNDDPVASLEAATKQYVDNATNSAIGTLTTDDVIEGTNLYYTDSRSRTAISVTGSLNYNPSTGVISYVEPVLSTVALSGSFNDLLDVPTDLISGNSVIDGGLF